MSRKSVQLRSTHDLPSSHQTSQDDVKSAFSEEFSDSDDDVGSTVTSSSTSSFHTSRMIRALSSIGLSDSSPSFQRPRISSSPNTLLTVNTRLSQTLSRFPGASSPNPSPRPNENTQGNGSVENESGFLRKLQSALGRSRRDEPQADLSDRQLDAIAREKRSIETVSLWEDEMIPHFEDRKGSRRFRSLMWKGIPSKLRGRVWSLCVGNTMNIRPELFEIMVKNATTSRRVVEGALRRGESEAEIEILFPGKVANISAIRLDLERTFPEIGFFHEGTADHNNLRNLLEAFVSYRPDIGYVSGMSFVAAKLLLNMEPYPAFVCFVHFTSCPVLLPFYMSDTRQVKEIFSIFDRLLAEYLPELNRHFASIQMDCHFYIPVWFRSIFTTLPNLEIVARIWDMWVLDRDVFLYRAALGILKYLSPRLMGNRFETCVQVLMSFGKSATETKVMKAIKSISLTTDHLRQVASHPRKG